MSVDFDTPNGPGLVEPQLDPYALRLVVDLDERGSFRAHVETSSGKSVFSFSNECEDGSTDVLWLVDIGYMRHARDVDGLLDYLQSAGLVGANATLTLEG
ncbi:hypothetical protein LJR129_005047 [Acidovorax sp. LjRoot129]|uniref:hypothetical protein n=1 Tax=unclassified Acidovorax TaxID=2684926 RepID=UPI003ECEB24B